MDGRAPDTFSLKVDTCFSTSKLTSIPLAFATWKASTAHAIATLLAWSLAIISPTLIRQMVQQALLAQLLMNFFQITELLLHSSQLSVDPWSSETGHIGHQHLCAIRPPKRGQKKPSWPSQLFLAPSLRTWRAALDPKCSQQNLTVNELTINSDKCLNLWRFWQSQLCQSNKKQSSQKNKNLHQLPTPPPKPPLQTPNPDLVPSSSTSGQCSCTNVHVEMTSLTFFVADLLNL